MAQLDDLPDEIQEYIANMLEGGDRTSLALADKRRNAVVEGLRARTREAIATFQSEKRELEGHLAKIKVDIDKAAIAVMKKAGYTPKQIEAEMKNADSNVRKNAKKRVDAYLLNYKTSLKAGIRNLDDLIADYTARL